MSNLSGNCDFKMELAQRNRLHETDDAVREHSGVIAFSAEGTAVHSLGGSSRINSTLKRKACRDSFMVWVVITRNQALRRSEHTELQRRKCPLIDCERPFKDPEAMFQHVHQCLLLSKGTYRCFKCGNEERIGRYHTKICPEQSKDRFVKLANSVRVVKRFLSRHALKRSAQRPQHFDVRHPGLAELPFSAFHPPVEMDAKYFDGPAELFGGELPSELESFDGWMWMASNTGMESMLLPELGDGSDQIPTAMHFVAPQHAAAELDASAHSVSTPDLRGKASTWIQAGIVNGDGRQLHAQHPSANRPLQLNTSCVYQGLHEKPRVGVASQPSWDTTIDDTVSPMSPTTHEHHHITTVALSPRESIAAPDELYPPGLSGASSSSSTPKSSMSSFDMSNALTENYQLSSTTICTGYGSDMLYTDPEELDSFPVLEELRKAPAINDQFYWPPAPGDMDFGGHIMPPAPLFSDFPHHAINTNTVRQEALLPSPPISSTLFSPTPKYKCECGYEPSGKEANKHSNFKRHQNTACKWRLGDNPKSHRCNYPRCGKSYPRRDNLLAHQRKQNHSGSVNLELQYNSTSAPLSATNWGIFEMEGSEVRPLKRSRTD